MTTLITKDKDNAVADVMSKVLAILKVNTLDLRDLDGKVLNSIIMAYQQGLKDAKDILNHV